MSRTRYVKPGLFTNEELAECSFGARYLFVGLWTLADREGRVEDRPRKIKGELLPFDVIEVEDFLWELHDRGFIVRYESDGRRVIWIKTFSKHQRPHPNEVASTLPPFAEGVRIRSRREGEDSYQGAIGSDQGASDSRLNAFNFNSNLDLNSDSDSNLDSGPTALLSAKADVRGCVNQVYDHYRSYHPRSAPTLTSKSEGYKKIAARLKEGYGVDQLKLAIDGNHRDPFHCGENQRGIRYHDLTLIVRDSDHVRKFIEIAEHGNAPVLSEREQRGKRAVESWVAKMEAESA